MGRVVAPTGVQSLFPGMDAVEDKESVRWRFFGLFGLEEGNIETSVGTVESVEAGEGGGATFFLRFFGVADVEGDASLFLETSGGAAEVEG